MKGPRALLAPTAPPHQEQPVESARCPVAPTRGRPSTLYAGQVLAPAEPTTVTTILGSCVALCLWDSARAAGGINHYLLPDSPIGDRFSGRFAQVACERLLEALLVAGSERRHLTAKVFGGACVIDALQGSAHHLGARNVEAAMAFLEDERIPLVASDVGGRYGRRVVYDTQSGDAWVRAIQRGGGRGR